ncbi:MAG TPA: hypothetical protein VF979_09925 [Streptosporangiaceae bacterium]
MLALSGQLADPVEQQTVPGQLRLEAETRVLGNEVVGDGLVRPGPLSQVAERQIPNLSIS